MCIHNSCHFSRYYVYPKYINAKLILTDFFIRLTMKFQAIEFIYFSECTVHNMNDMERAK